MKKQSIKRLINLEEKDGKKNTIARLKARYDYLKSNSSPWENNVSNQMKYVGFHLKKLGVKI